VRETRWQVIAGFLVAAATAPLALRLLFEREWDVVQRIHDVTNGLVHASLLFGGAATLVFVGGLFLGLGRLRAQDVGLVGSRLPIALLSTLGLWLVTQAVLVLASWASGREVALDSAWTDLGLSAVLGRLLGQVVGMALFEETTFRGFLLPQLYIKFSADRRRVEARPLVWAILASQFFFALCHLPNRLFETVGGPVVLELLTTTMVGVGISLVYLRTGNLWLVAGLHGLGNRPTPVFESPVDPNVVLSVLVVMLLLCWPWLERSVLGQPALSRRSGAQRQGDGAALQSDTS